MRQTELIMGMPITVIGGNEFADVISRVFAYFRQVDEQFSTYKPTSEITHINQGLPEQQWSPSMKEVMQKCAQTKQQTHGYFDIVTADGSYDPSGLVKGWAIAQASEMMRAAGCSDFSIEAGGDIQAFGHNTEGQPWRIGIRNPLNVDEIVKVLQTTDGAVATSGTYIRGQHIYNPHVRQAPASNIVSLTVVGPDIYDADRFATAAFAMGQAAIAFIASLPGLEGFMIDRHGTATYTEGFNAYVATTTA